MMKKLVALVLVLGLCSLANAGLTIGYDAATSTVSISGDGATVNFAAYLLVEGPGSIAGGTIVYPPASVAGTLCSYQDLEAAAADAGITPAEYLGLVKDMTGKTVADLSFMTIVDTAVPAASTAGLLVDGIKLTLTDKVTLTLTSDDFATTYNSMEVVPEPLTIVLLGLGGLLLRRRS
jgi:hypothetical protein